MTQREAVVEPIREHFDRANGPAHVAPYRLIDDVEFADGVVVFAFANLYGCRIGDRTRIGPCFEIQRGVEIGRRCKIQSHAFICTGVKVEDEVFVGHGVVFINDKRPVGVNDRSELATAEDWELLPAVVERGASIGSGAVILGGLRIGAGALVGGGRGRDERRSARRGRRSEPCAGPLETRPDPLKLVLPLWIEQPITLT